MASPRRTRTYSIWRLSAIEDEFTRLEKEHGMGKATLKCDKPPEKLVEAIDKLEEKTMAFKL